jgi:hypothetical protein
MPMCNCGCMKVTRGGDFAPGHDQALRAKIERRTGGLLRLERLIDSVEAYAEGRMSRDGLDERIKITFPKM